MSAFDDDTRLTALPPGPDTPPGTQRFAGHVHPAWNIGQNPNGGYLLALAGAALGQALPDQPDALSITAHYLRPGLADQPCHVDVQVLRSGRSLSTARATLWQAGGARLELLAAMGTLSTLAEPGNPGDAGGAPSPHVNLPAPVMPPPEACPGRSAVAQGVGLPILNRLDVRLHPDQAQPGQSSRAEVSGWIRFADGRSPDALGCLLMTDAFPPAVFSLLGLVGWVPTVELTVHLRRRPVAGQGWLQGRFTTDDLCDGRVIEDGALWDASGQLVAQSRQLALLRLPAAGAAP